MIVLSLVNLLSFSNECNETMIQYARDTHEIGWFLSDLFLSEIRTKRLKINRKKTANILIDFYTLHFDCIHLNTHLPSNG